MELIIGIVIIFGFMLIMGLLFQHDLKQMEKTHLKYRKYLKDTYNI